MAEKTVRVGHTYVIRNPRVKWDKRVVVHSYFDRPVVQYTNREDGSDHWLYEQMFLDRYAHAPDCSCKQDFREPIVKYIITGDGFKHRLYRRMFPDRYIHAPDCLCRQKGVKELSQIERDVTQKKELMEDLLDLISTWASSWGLDRHMPIGAERDLAKMIRDPKPVLGPLPYRERKDDTLIAITKRLRPPHRRS